MAAALRLQLGNALEPLTHVVDLRGVGLGLGVGLGSVERERPSRLRQLFKDETLIYATTEMRA